MAPRRTRGVSLVEVAMAILISVIVGGTVLTFFGGASTAQGTTQTIVQVSTLVDQAHKMAMGQNSYANLSAVALIQAGGLPSSLINSAGTGFVNAFKGTLTVAPVAGNAQFSISAAGLPVEACGKLSAVDLGPSVTAVSISTANFTPRPTIAQAAAACAAAVPATVSWTLK